MSDTVDDAVVQIVDRVEAASKEYLAWARSHPAASLEEVEARALEEMRSYGQRLLGLGLAQQQTHEAAPACPRCGGGATRHGYGQRTVVSRAGAVSVAAARWRYARYRREGYDLGSGHIESLCKQLGRRLKGADRTWSRPGLRAVTTLLCQRITWQNALPKAA